MGDTKLDRFLPKNQHMQRNCEVWINNELSKSAKNLTFKNPNISLFFSLKNVNLGAHFLLLTFFDSINF